MLICAVEGPANPSFLERLDVQWYPTLKIVDRASKTVWCVCCLLSSLLALVCMCLW